jgi:hypothetical protein
MFYQEVLDGSLQYYRILIFSVCKIFLCYCNVKLTLTLQKICHSAERSDKGI